MKKLLFVVLIVFLGGNIIPQTWQALLPAPGAGVTDMVYWNGGGVNFGNKLWVSTSSYNWPNGQWGGVFWNETSGLGGWHQVAGGYIARTLAVGQDGKLYASIWYDPAFQVADALSVFVPQVGIFSTLYQAQAGDNIFSIAVKNSPHTIFGGTRNGVIRSTDNGVSFGYANTGIPDSSWVYDIAIDSSGILAIASSNGVFISEDNGDTWLTTTGISPEDTVRTLLFINDTTSTGLSNKTKQDFSKLYSGSYSGNLFKSLGSQQYSNFTSTYNFGEEISGAKKIGSFDEIIAIQRRYYGGRSNNKILGLTGVYKSTDEGTTWSQINDGLPTDPPVSALGLKIINETSAELFAGLFNDTTNGAGIYKLGITVGVEETDNEIPSTYKLEQNYPNPFNPSTIIQFSLPEPSFVKMEIFNALGEKVSTLVSEELNAGNYKYEWNANGHPSGIYFYKLKTIDFEQTRKLVLLK